MTDRTNSLKEERQRLMDELLYEEPASEKYKQIMDRLVDIDLLSRRDKLNVSGDTLVMASVNLLGILLILQHEKMNVVATKALSFVTKLRL